MIISGGGTAGHIYPAIAIANECKRRYPDVSILFVGAQDRMEMQKVPKEGYPIKGLWISGIQRKLTWKNMMFPFKIISSLWKSMKIIWNFKPDIVVGTGGFASGPVLFVASIKKIPTLIQEQNSYAGITNKLLSKSVNKVCVAYKNMNVFFPKDKIIQTGNPVRQDLLSIEGKRSQALAKYGLDPSKKTVLVIGGSLGARRINQLIENELVFFKALGLQIIWQCGAYYISNYKKYNTPSEGVQVHQFLDTMDLAYAAADIIISRAGASSVSELCIVGKPVIFIPSPNVAEDHQTKNALAVVEREGALMIKESELNDKFEESMKSLLQSETLQQSLSSNIKLLAQPDATNKIVNEIEYLLR